MKLANKMINTFESNEGYDPSDKPIAKQAYTALGKVHSDFERIIRMYSRIDPDGASEMEDTLEELEDHLMHLEVALNDEDDMGEADDSSDKIAKLKAQYGKLQADLDTAMDIHWDKVRSGKNPSSKVSTLSAKMKKIEILIKELEDMNKEISEKDVSKLTQVNSLRDKIKDRRNTIQGLKDQENKLRDKKQKLDDPVKRKPLQDQIDKLIASISDLEAMNREDQDKINKLKK